MDDKTIEALASGDRRDPHAAAETPEADYVREFLAEIERPEVLLRTDENSMPYAGARNWGVKGKAAIAAALRDALQKSNS
jgi:hypothetical protein